MSGYSRAGKASADKRKAKLLESNSIDSTFVEETLQPSTSTSTETNHNTSSSENESAREDVFQMQENGNSNKNYDVELHLDDWGWDAARDAANGWDKNVLARAFSKNVRNGRLEAPHDANKAFPAWIPKYTKGKPPA